MKKIIFILFFVFVFIISYASDFFITLKFAGALSENMLMSRELSIEHNHNCKNCTLNCSFALSQESFNNLLWGATNRFSFKCNLLFGDKENIFLKIGPGVSVASSYDIYSLSPDIYLKFYIFNFFIFLDTSFYSDGLFNKSGIGYEWKWWDILFDFGLCNIFISNYKDNFFKLRFQIGVGYEF